MIYYFTPWSIQKNIGQTYNQYMDLLSKDDDWAVFMDGDTMFLTEDWGDYINKFIQQHLYAGLITCYTNRIGFAQQRWTEKMDTNSDIVYHKKLALAIRNANGFKFKRIEKGAGAFMMCICKKVWKEVKFSEDIGILGVDTDWTRRLLEKEYSIICMEGLYVFHYYRLIEGRKYRKHLMLNNGEQYLDTYKGPRKR